MRTRHSLMIYALHDTMKTRPLTGGIGIGIDTEMRRRVANESTEFPFPRKHREVPWELVGPTQGLHDRALCDQVVGEVIRTFDVIIGNGFAEAVLFDERVRFRSYTGGCPHTGSDLDLVDGGQTELESRIVFAERIGLDEVGRVARGRDLDYRLGAFERNRSPVAREHQVCSYR